MTLGLLRRTLALPGALGTGRERKDWRPSRLANQIPTRRLLFTTRAGYDSGRIARSMSEQVAKALIANAVQLRERSRR